MAASWRSGRGFAARRTGKGGARHQVDQGKCPRSQGPAAGQQLSRGCGAVGWCGRCKNALHQKDARRLWRGTLSICPRRRLCGCRPRSGASHINWNKRSALRSARSRASDGQRRPLRPRNTCSRKRGTRSIETPCPWILRVPQRMAVHRETKFRQRARALNHKPEPSKRRQPGEWRFRGAP
jgi:hypothetical protein